MILWTLVSRSTGEIVESAFLSKLYCNITTHAHKLGSTVICVCWHSASGGGRAADPQPAARVVRATGRPESTMQQQQQLVLAAGQQQHGESAVLPASATYEEKLKVFFEELQRMCKIEDQLKAEGAARRAVSKEFNTLKSGVVEFMKENAVDAINYGENEVLYLEAREQAGSLTRSRLLEAIKAFHGVENVEVTEEEAESLEPDVRDSLQEAQALIDFVNEYLGVDEKVVLVRRDKNKPTRKRPRPAKTLSVYASVPAQGKNKAAKTGSDGEDDDDDDQDAEDDGSLR